MINEFAIPAGSKLYFGQSAKKKREIEKKAIEIFYQNGFEEISTPIFSYHHNLQDKHYAITFKDTSNNNVYLREDSSKDVVRLITKRLGRSTAHKKWFYIQSIFRYPTTQINQIGCEWIDNNKLEDALNLCIDMLSCFEKEYFIQLGNIKIAALASQESGIDFHFFAKQDYTVINNSNIKWLKELFSISSVQDLQNSYKLMPSSIQKELKKLENFALKSNQKVVISPLFHTELELYDSLFFRILKDNKQLAMGGRYKVEENPSVGFALYVDRLLGD